MSCGAFARQRCPAAALGMALLFLWLKCWQAVFTSALRARLAASPESKWNLSPGAADASRPGHPPTVAAFSVAAGLYRHHSLRAGCWLFTRTSPCWAMALKPACPRRAAPGRRAGPPLAPTKPSAARAACAGGRRPLAQRRCGRLYRAATAQNVPWHRDHLQPVRHLGIFNTTFLAVTVAVAWLALDPLLKAVYTLRCFHGEARTDGADLLAELSCVRAARQIAGRRAD